MNRSNNVIMILFTFWIQKILLDPENMKMIICDNNIELKKLIILPENNETIATNHTLLDVCILWVGVYGCGCVRDSHCECVYVCVCVWGFVFVCMGVCLCVIVCKLVCVKVSVCCVGLCASVYMYMCVIACYVWMSVWMLCCCMYVCVWFLWGGVNSFGCVCMRVYLYICECIEMCESMFVVL